MLYFFKKSNKKNLFHQIVLLLLKYNNQKITEDFMKSVIGRIIAVFLLIFLMFSFIMSLTGLDFITAISGAASSISNVGPGLGDIIGPNGNYKNIPDASNGFYLLVCY